MVIVAIFLESVATLLSSLIFLYILVVIAGAVLTWVNIDPYNPIVQMIRKLTEPVYAYMRSYIPTTYNGVDFAPFILVVALQFIDLFIVKLLLHFANSLGS
jgi:YggT family protein